MRKLYIIEGTPGTGKTTFATKLAEHLRKKNQSVNLYVEGDMHPADMAWNALLTKQEFEQVKQGNPDYAEAIQENSTTWMDKYIVAYTKLDHLTQELWNYFESKEIYDGRVGAATFCGVHQDRWSAFAKNAKDTTIFECVLLQNSVNELYLFNCSSEEMITSYVKALAESVQELDPEIIYLDVDTKEGLERAARERVNEQGERMWEPRVIEYVENAPLGKEKGLKGREGMDEYFCSRKEMELRILESLPVKSHVIPIDINDQAKQVEEWIEKNI